MNGIVSASSTIPVVPGFAARRMRSRTASALAKKSPLSGRSTTMPGTGSFSGMADEVGVLAGRAGDAAELGDVRPRRAVEQQQQRDGDADEEAGQRVEDEHAEHAPRPRR